MANNERTRNGEEGFSLRDGEAGFSLIETMIAMAILATGLLSLAGVFILGLSQLNTGSAGLIAREKAREAVESVHTARDTKTIAWCQIRNLGTPTGCANGAAGKFLTGLLDLKVPGPDGLVNTSDDGSIEVLTGPGVDNVLGTGDDTQTPLTNYKRQIEIADILLPNGQVNPNLRQVRVTVTYVVGKTNRTYTLTTYISAIS
jgi:prepilin-type N-terminal cleavage/methylation domain-containing protein